MKGKVHWGVVVEPAEDCCERRASWGKVYHPDEAPACRCGTVRAAGVVRDRPRMTYQQENEY